MNTIKNFVLTVSAVAATAAIFSGCSTPTIPVTMNVTGEIKMGGVSKIALIDFNTLPDDPLTGTLAADPETCGLVQRSVASAFYKVPTYKIANLTHEQAIAAVQDANPAKRFDALVYGRIWWQITPETDGEYPVKYTLDQWENVPYKTQDPITKKDVVKIAKLMTMKTDVIKMLKYRTKSASLMLSLSFYRIDGNGNVSKIVDTYQVSEGGFTLMNGNIKVETSEIGIKNDSELARLQKTGNNKKQTTAYQDMFAEKGLLDFSGVLPKEKQGPKAKVDANGKVILTQETVTIPSELQAKLMLASRIANDISSKVAPSEMTFQSPWVDKKILFAFEKRFDARLTNLLQNRAWDATKAYAAFKIRELVGEENADDFKSIEDIPATYPVAKSEKTFTAEEAEKKLAYLIDKKVDIYLYAIAIACEATGDMYGAIDTYTEAFNLKPTAETALGISRCNMALGQDEKINNVNKAVKAATKKATLN